MNAARLLLALFFILAGLNHFISPSLYIALVPSSLPWAGLLVAISGGAEILGGLGLLPSATRVVAGWGLIALLLAVFPANVQAVNSGMSIGGHAVPAWLLWARLPLQGLLIAWVYWVSVRAR